MGKSKAAANLEARRKKKDKRKQTHQHEDSHLNQSTDSYVPTVRNFSNISGEFSLAPRPRAKRGPWEAGVDGYVVYAIAVLIDLDGCIPASTMIVVIVVDDESGVAGLGDLRNVWAF